MADQRATTPTDIAPVDTILDLCQAAAWQYDCDRQLFFFNDAYWRIVHGVSAPPQTDEVSPAAFAERWLPPASRVIMQRELAAACAATDPYERRFDAAALRADGSIVWTAVAFRVVHADDGHVCRLIGVNQVVTDRRDAEEALRRSEQQLRAAEAQKTAIINGMSGVVVHYLDRDSRVIWTNDPQMTVGEVCYRARHGADRPCAGCSLPVAIQTGSRTESELTTSENEAFLTRSNPVRDEHGAIIGFVQIGTNITTIRRAERELRRSAAQLYRLIAALPAPVAMFDRHGAGLAASHAWHEVFPEHLPLPHLSNLPIVDGEPATIWQDRLDQVVTGNECSGRATDVDPRCQTPRHLAWTLNPWTETNGHVGGAICVIDDVTQHEETARRLQMLRDHEQALTRCSHAVLVDTAGREGGVDAALAELLHVTGVCRVYLFQNVRHPELGWCVRQTHEAVAEGVTAQMGNPDLQMVPLDNVLPGWAPRFARGEALAQKVADLPGPQRAHFAAQGIRSLLAIPVVVDDDWLGLVGFDDTRSDRTWQPEHVRLLQSAAEMLGAHLLREKHLRDLEERNLALAELRDEAEAASRAKSNFLANMSHEIRTPLTAIMGYLDLVGEWCSRAPGDDGQSIRNYLETISRNGQHLLQIINDILDLSKIDAGRVTVEQVPCAPLEVAIDVESLLRVRAIGKNITLAVEKAGAIPATIRSDPTRLRQILLNLVGNAIKFTETGGVRIVIRLLPPNEREPQPLLEFAVVDTGIGMNDADLHNLFQPFSQADTSFTRRFGGTGLGLVISKRLAEILGGRIEASARPGAGSTFRLLINPGPLDNVPMLPADAPVTCRPRTSTTRPGDAQLTGRIVLAEDGPDNQRLIALLLRRAGLNVTTVENGRLACDAVTAAAAEEPFDLVLMDMQMPEMDGYAATRWLRDNGYDLPVIALTAHAMSGDREKCLEAGCTDYATKPIDRAALLSLLRRYLAPPPQSPLRTTHATPRSSP